MKYYKHTETGEVFAYETESERQEWGAPELVEMTPAEIDTHINPPPEPPAMPNQVSRRQAKQALILAGLYDQVQSAIDAIEDAQERLMMQVFWDDSITFERENPQLQSMAMALNLSAEQLDDLFVQAANL